MPTDKKNQHYLPKFYLRNFSFQNNKKQLGIYNIFNKIYFNQAKLKTQGSKDFFYGFDGIIEDSLANIEGKFASVIKKILECNNLPINKSPDYYDLLSFVVLTDLRNPVAIENAKNRVVEMHKRILDLDPQIDSENLPPQLTHDQAVTLSISHLFRVVPYILDLDCKLLINGTVKPFITSDFPIIKYNQFLEYRKWQYGKTGYGMVGLQLFVPLNPKIALIFFDRNIYKVGGRRKTFNITNENDVDSINMLQFVNCLGSIYFDDSATEKYIRGLHFLAARFKKANIIRSKVTFLRKFDEDYKRQLRPEKENLLILGSTDCETKLKIDGIKIHSKGKSHKLNSSMAQFRPWTEKLMSMQNEP